MATKKVATKKVKTNTVDYTHPNEDVRGKLNEEIDKDLLNESLETSNKKFNEISIFHNFGQEPEEVAIVGVAMSRKTFQDEQDLMMHLKIVREGAEQPKVMSLRHFAGRNFAYRDMAKLVKEHGAKVTSLNGGNPNLKDYRWFGVESFIVRVTTRQSTNGLFYPNKIVEVKPKVVEIPETGNFLDVGMDMSMEVSQ
jgi:hypothetical protein